MVLAAGIITLIIYNEGNNCKIKNRYLTNFLTSLTS